MVKLVMKALHICKSPSVSINLLFSFRERLHRIRSEVTRSNAKVVDFVIIDERQYVFIT